MKSRIIDPLFFKDEFIGELEPLAMVTFIGLWCLADREGRLEDRPKWINAELFPYSNVITCDDIERQLNTLSTIHPFIQRYTVDGKRFIQITNFSKHQHVHPHERRSIIPKCTDVITCHAMSGALTSTSTYTSPLPPAEEKPKKSRVKRVRPAGEWQAWFDKWWAVYPKKKEIEDAEKAFRKQITSLDLLEKAMRAVELKLGGLDNPKPEFFKLPATWLNKKPWRDMEIQQPALFQQPAETRKSLDVQAYLKSLREDDAA